MDKEKSSHSVNETKGELQEAFKQSQSDQSNKMKKHKIMKQHMETKLKKELTLLKTESGKERRFIIAEKNRISIIIPIICISKTYLCFKYKM